MAVLMVRERGITTAVKKRAKVNVSLLFFSNNNPGKNCKISRILDTMA